MKKVEKITSLVCCLLLLVFGLMGCSSSNDIAKESPKKVKVAEGTKAVDHDSESNTESNTKKERQNIQKETSAAVTNTAEEKKTQQPVTDTAKTAQSTEITTAAKSEAGENNSKTTNATNKSTTTSTSKTQNTTNSSQSKTAPKANTTTTAKTNSTTQTKPNVTAQKPAETVTISIAGPKERGTILAPTKISIKDGDTIFSTIVQAAKKQGIVIDSSGSGATAYIEGIDNIYEFDYGAKSGWVFKQNGVSITKSTGAIKVKDGDKIECYYTE